jgi:5-methylcytosine-specific restriction enzyme B
MPAVSLADFARTFDRTSFRPRLQEAETHRQRLRELFPREQLADLPLEKYAIGLGQGTLCYEYEFGSRVIGSVAGGSAGKFLVFFNKAKGVWKSTLREEPDAHKAWELLRADLVRALDLAEAGRWDEIDALPVAGFTPSLRGKMSHVFFPDKVVPIFSFALLQHFLRELGIIFKYTKGVYATAANQRLLQELRRIPELDDWSTSELAYLLHEWSPPPAKKRALSFEDFIESFDRDKLEPQLQEAEKQRQHILQAYPLESLGALSMERYAGGNEVSKDNLAPLLARGSSAIGGNIRGVGGNAVGIMQLKGTGLYRSTLREAGDAADDWLKLRAALIKCCELAQQGDWAGIDTVSPANWIPALRTKLLHVYFPDEVLPMFLGPELSYYLDQLGIDEKSAPGKYAAVPNRRLLEHLRSLPTLQDWSTLEMVMALREWSPASVPEPEEKPPTTPVMPPAALNRILYGPPGTGKTYNVIREAARIVTGDHSLDDAAARHAFDEALKSGRIRLATFHQSFSYEDFIEGIRPAMDEESGTARFEVRDGLFKKMALEALFACLEPVEDNAQGVTDPALARELRRPRAGTITRRIWDLADQLQNRQAVLKAALEEGINISTAATQWVGWKATQKAMQSNTTSFDADGARAQAQSYLTLAENSGWRMSDSRPPYVLIIDEINRGNISRIFGELITLIEEDKRHSADNALSVVLPVSGEVFSVPPNLHLLGTMNTADKSLALLDVALRRRFDFTELPPDFSLCQGLTPAMKEVLLALNDRLEKRKDRDHRIGHAFFIGVTTVDEFNEAFKRKVVPLLQEYFFNDIEGARYVLGEDEKDNDGGFLRRLDGDSRHQRNRWRWFTDVEPTMDCWARLEMTLPE